MLKFNAKKFLSLPVNDGNVYLDEKGCGCAKGNFHRATLEGEEVLLPDYILGIHAGLKYNMTGSEYIEDALHHVLNRAEIIHMGRVLKFKAGNIRRDGIGRPQYAKLFLLRALRRFNLVEFVGEEDQCQIVIQKETSSCLS